VLCDGFHKKDLSSVKLVQARIFGSLPVVETRSPSRKFKNLVSVQIMWTSTIFGHLTMAINCCGGRFLS
jgi:hypothetical protein